MQSASRLLCVTTLPEPAKSLFAVMNELLRAVDGRVVLLRPLAGNFDDQRDDIDLLLTESQRKQLLRAAYARCVLGDIHCRIQQNSPTKIQLILWTKACSSKLMIDLWTSFDQLPRRRYNAISAERLLNTLTDANVSQRRENVHECLQIPTLRLLPADIDFCLLVQHLAAKRRKLTTPARRERIVAACERLQSLASASVHDSLLTALLDLASRLPLAIIVTPNFIKVTDAYLLQRLAAVPNNRGLPVLERRQRRGLVTELRKAILQRRPAVAVVGSDGTGKSSIVAALASQQPHSMVVVAKKFYRRSLAYQFVGGLIKRLCRMDRGDFDDRVSPWISIRAAAAFWVTMCLPFSLWSKSKVSGTAVNGPVSVGELSRSKRTLILDRSCVTFLITKRKSDAPQLTPSATWIEAMTPPVSSVLLTLPYTVLAQRKQEMSSAGHEIYQYLLFEQALRQRPTDLTLLAGLPSAEESAAALCKILQWVSQPVRESQTATEFGKVAA